MKKSLFPKIIILAASLILAALFLPGCRANQETIKPSDPQAETGPGVTIKDLSVSGSEFYPGEEAVFKVTVSGKPDQNEAYWAGCSIKDPSGTWHDLPAQKIALDEQTETTVEFAWPVPEKEQLISGGYQLSVAVWSNKPGAAGAERLSTLEKEDAFQVFRHYEDFSFYNEDLWEKSSHPLGLGNLDPHNLTIEDDLLKITLPAGTHDGGQIETKAADHFYGSYRARIKLPDVPSSITGFFLYKAPDFEHEIDIEILNGTCGTIWFTTYAGGEMSNASEASLAFDPTGDFHEYRFDFYPGEVHFYVEGELLQTFSSGLPGRPMHLMLNSWFPYWLEGEKPDHDAVTLVDWIKY